jgi:hypothetical protein
MKTEAKIEVYSIRLKIYLTQKILNMKNLFALFLTLCPLVIFAQTKSFQNSPQLIEGVASNVGMSEERLARIDAMCQEAVDESQIPGAVALVARKGKIVYYKAFGMADNESGRILKKDDIFRIASLWGWPAKDINGSEKIGGNYAESLLLWSIRETC